MVMSLSPESSADVSASNSVKKASHFRPKFVCRYGNTAIGILLTAYFFLIPAGLIMYDLNDKGLRGQSISRFALRVHRQLSPKYEKWARKRVALGKAEQLTIEQIAPTEWPLFGSVFYLLATESIQEAWEKDNCLCTVAPNVYSRGAIEAAAELVIDPSHATWVREHWGEDYLEKENVFYRMLIINALTSYQKLLCSDKYEPMLRGQVESLSKELDESWYGLLDDYPGECYPTDVVTAIAAIKRADAVLGTDHSGFVKRSLRGFDGHLLTEIGLPPYSAVSQTGATGVARGCSSQWGIVWAPMLWPETAKQWYEAFEEHFWQERWGAVGFLEFPKSAHGGHTYIDVDSGPVIAGFGAAASAFGIGAARANGRFDHAYPLSAQMILLSWPLPDGTLVLPRLLSNSTHAPYLGEACLLFALTRVPPEDLEIRTGGELPGCVYLGLILYLGIGVVCMSAFWMVFRNWRRRASKEPIVFEKLQLAVWILLVVTGLVVAVSYRLPIGLLFILAAQFLPVGGKWKPKRRPIEA